MKKSLILLLFFIAIFCSAISGYSQNGFTLPAHQKKERIPFRLINNLPVIPVEVNGTKLSFILDTGIKNTIIFSLENADSLVLKDSKPIQLQGLGEGGTVDALKSLQNVIKVGDATDNDHTLYVIFDSALNFSRRMGVPIHGILGNDFFKNFIVKINYAAEKITLYRPEHYSFKKCRKCQDFEIKLVEHKPYINLELKSKEAIEEVTLLIDSGSSDALWLFNPENFIEETPQNYFKDFLGLGLSGNIFGKRSKIEEVRIGKIVMPNVNASFPDAEAIKRARLFKERDGSIGGGFLSRFTVIFDYGNKKIRLRKNRNFGNPYHYNMSGLVVEHDGMEYVPIEKETSRRGREMSKAAAESTAKVNIPVTIEYELALVPRYIVAGVIENSPAALAGIQNGDLILSINGKAAYNYPLYELIELFSKEEGNRISMEINRNGTILKIKFSLKNML